MVSRLLSDARVESLHVRINFRLFHSSEPNETEVRQDEATAGGGFVVNELEVEISVVKGIGRKPTNNKRKIETEGKANDQSE
jgi:hypothetical protein